MSFLPRNLPGGCNNIHFTFPTILSNSRRSNEMSLKDYVIPKAEVIEACKKGEYDKVALFLSSKRGKKMRAGLKYVFFVNFHLKLFFSDFSHQKATVTGSLTTKMRNPILLFSTTPFWKIRKKSASSLWTLSLFCCWVRALKTFSRSIWPHGMETWRLSKCCFFKPWRSQWIFWMQWTSSTKHHSTWQFKEGIWMLCSTLSKWEIFSLTNQNVLFFFQKNADPFIRNENKENALDVASRMGSAEAIRLLCEKWPKFAIQSAYESLRHGTLDIKRNFPAIYPFHLAAKYNHVECMQVSRLSKFPIHYSVIELRVNVKRSGCVIVDIAPCLFMQTIGNCCCVGKKRRIDEKIEKKMKHTGKRVIKGKFGRF